MTGILFGGALFVGIFGGTFIESISTPVVYAREPEEQIIQVAVKIDWTPERIDKEIVSQAEAYGVSADVMRKVIQCESMGSTTIQSYHRRPDGSREQSFGLAQIYLPAHPHITREQATEPAFAIDFMAREMSEGNAWKWSCWKQMQ